MTSAEDLAYAGVARQAELVREGAVSSRELTEVLLRRIERLDPQLNAFRCVMAEEALAEAGARDAAGAQGPLHGVPVAIKDENDVAGQVTTFGTRAQVRPAAADGEVARRLRAAGAVVIGKTTMPEFGQWPFTESSTFGITRNPWDLDRTPGGSSGGTGAAVAAGLVAAAIGGDGGGSIRIPSACCGLFGLKPQRGRVSAAPAEHLWMALGVLGPLTRSVLDSALVLDAIRGTAPGGRFVAQEPRASFVDAARTAPGRLRIAVSTRSTTPGVGPDADQARALTQTAGLLRGLGHDVVELDARLPDITAAFVPQLLRGVREEADAMDRPDLLERRTRRHLALARLMPRRGAELAIRLGERLADRVDRSHFAQHDLLLTPTLPRPARPVGALDGAGLVEAQLRSLPWIAYTAIWNVTGHPAASVPAGFTAGGLPLAVQLVGRRHDEPTILQVAAQLEQARPWAGRRPSL